METDIIKNDLDSFHNSCRPRWGFRTKKYRINMEDTYNITLFNECTQEYFSKQQNFVTFEEAVVHANHTRHRFGMDWKTVSISKILKGEGDNVDSIKEA